MSFLKKTWFARIGTGLNRFLQNGTDYVTLQSAPESVTQQGDALSADNMNNLEQRIADAFDALDDEILTDEPSTTDTTHALTNAFATQIHKQTNARLENLEQKAGDYVEVQYRGTDAVPTGKAKYGIVNTIVGKTRAWNQLIPLLTASNFTTGTIYSSVLSNDSDGNLVATSASGIEISCACPFVSGRKYLVSVILKSSISGSIAFFADSTNLKVESIPSANTYQTITEILSPNANTAKFRIVRSASASETLTVNKWLLRDLTLIFGAGNEPTTVADALAQLPALGQYNAYDAGSLVSTEVSGVESKDTSDNVLDTISLPEIVTLKSAGSVSDELDVESGRVTHPVYELDLSEQNWSYQSGYGIWVATPTKAPKNVGSVVSDKYVCTTKTPNNISAGELTTLWSWWGSTPQIFVNNGSSVDSPTGSLVYELNTPDPSTFIDPVPYNFLEVEGGGTIDTIQEQSPVIDNCLDVGYLAL